MDSRRKNRNGVSSHLNLRGRHSPDLISDAEAQCECYGSGPNGEFVWYTAQGNETQCNCYDCGPNGEFLYYTAQGGQDSTSSCKYQSSNGNWITVGPYCSGNHSWCKYEHSTTGNYCMLGPYCNNTCGNFCGHESCGGGCKNGTWWCNCGSWDPDYGYCGQYDSSAEQNTGIAC